jgi:predicted dehydrogenase
MTLFIDEGKWMIQAARKYNRIVTVGTQRRQGKGVAAARKVVEAGTLGKIHSVRMSSFRNIYPGFGIDARFRSAAGLRLRYVAGAGAQKAVHGAPRHLPFPLVLGLFGRANDQPGGAHYRPGVVDHERQGAFDGDVDGRRYALEDDGETPDLQDASWVFPTFTMNCAIREANASRGDPGQVYLGTKGTMTMAGGYQVASEQKIDPVNDIPRFMGQPIGGPVYTNTPRTPWITAQAGGVASDSRYGTGGEDTMAMNERDWLDCMRSRKRPLCEVEDGHRVSTTCNLANMSCGWGGRFAGIPRRNR